MSGSVELVKNTLNEVYEMVRTSNRSLLEEKLDKVYHEVQLLEAENRILLDRLHQVESERFD